MARSALPNCASVLLTGSEPIAISFSRSDGIAVARLISRLSFATIAGGTPAGATMPVHVVAS